MLYTHIAQLMTQTINVYIAIAYLAIMLLSLLAYFRVSVINSQEVCISFGHIESQSLFSQKGF